MGLISRLVLLPLAPVQGVLWLAETLQDIAEQEVSDPATLHQTLRDAEEAHARGELTAEQLAMVEQQVLDRLAPMTTYGEVRTDA